MKCLRTIISSPEQSEGQVPQLRLCATTFISYLKSIHHLINEQNINKIRLGAILSNAACGALVETSALVKALG